VALLVGEGRAQAAVALLVGVAEGKQAFRVYPSDSPWYGPLGPAVMAVTGAALAGPPRRPPTDQTGA
jgi:hypothetical protein